MKSLTRFIAILIGCLAVSVVCWDVFVTGRLYFCTDEVGFDFFTPGDWVHGEVESVPHIDSSVTMSEPDQILDTWSVNRLWVLWAGMVGASLQLSVSGCLVGRLSFGRPAARLKKQAEQVGDGDAEEAV